MRRCSENRGEFRGKTNGQHVRPAKEEEDDDICGRYKRASSNGVG